MLWLGVFFPLLPLEIFTAGRHGGGEAAEVVIDQGRVMLRNSAAMTAGIAWGSTLATAHSIVPGLVHHRRDAERERGRLRLLAEALYRFSARVSLAPPAGVALEIGASLRLFGNADELAAQAAGLCRELGHKVRVRQAPTPLGALLLARSDVASLGQVPLTQADVEPGRLSGERIERLANMGVRTLEQLLALPRRALASRFGDDLTDYLARITGARPDPRDSIRPADRFRTDLHLLEPLNSKEALAFPMQRLLTDLQHWLVARQLGAEQLRWHFLGSSTVSTGSLALPVRFANAQQSRNAFLDITRLQLAGAELPEDVISLGLEARRLAPWDAGSRSLFHHLPGRPDGQPASAEGPDTLVDQLRARLGREACYSLEVRDQHTPEQAWAAVAPQPPSPTQSAARRARLPASREKQPAPVLPRRPLWLFDPPRQVGRDQLTLLRGPERIHSAWWAGAGQTAEARDYYVARHRSGAECWAFVNPAQRWFLHGYFA